MEVSSLVNNANDSVGIEALKKAQDVQQNQATKMLQSLEEQTQQTQQIQQQVAQNSGLGGNLNVNA